MKRCKSTGEAEKGECFESAFGRAFSFFLRLSQLHLRGRGLGFDYVRTRGRRRTSPVRLRNLTFTFDTFSRGLTVLFASALQVSSSRRTH